MVTCFTSPLRCQRRLRRGRGVAAEPTDGYMRAISTIRCPYILREFLQRSEKSRICMKGEKTVRVIAVRHFKVDGVEFHPGNHLTLTPKMADHLLDRGQARRPLRHGRRTNGRVNQSERG